MKIKKILLSMLLLFSIVALSGCSFFEGEIEGVKDVEFSETEEGDIKVIVSYYDENETVKEEIIPSGLDGVDGTGIEEIIVDREKDASRNKVTIKLTDGTEKMFYVPDGVRIESVYSMFDEGTNETYMYLVYSDGTESDAIHLPKGDKGDGIDVPNSSVEMQEDGSIIVKWVYTDGTEQEFIIPAGKTGNGIDTIEPTEENGTYGLTITYTDGTIKLIEFTRPSVWYQGNGAPTLASNASIIANAIPGDYYLDFYGKKIYALTATSWEIIVDFAQTEEVYTVTFDPNDSDDPDHPVDAYNTRVTGIKFGATISGEDIPIPTRPGYVFKGWATSKTVKITTGFFTTLTPVTQNLTLYAIWEQE